MTATYQSPKPDGYLSTRNNVFRDRQVKQVVRTFDEQGACRNLPEQSKANYEMKPFK